jgi:hypothetical protein
MVNNIKLRIMTRFTVRGVNENGDIVNFLNTNHCHVAHAEEMDLRASGIEAWTCDNWQEIGVG